MIEMNVTNFRLTPSVVPVGIPTTVIITPRGENTQFAEGKTVVLSICGVETANTHIATTGFGADKLELKPQNGKLVFTYVFPREQQYVLKLNLDESERFYPRPFSQMAGCGRVPKYSDLAQPRLFLYALSRDLYGLRAYKGDFHLHSSDSDGHESSAGVLANLKKAGYDFAALTNHYWYHSFKKVNALWQDLPDLFTVLPGEEVHAPVEYFHSVSIGARESVNDLYYQNKELCNAEIAEIQKSLDLPDDIDSYNYAAQIWSVRKIHEVGGMAVMVHPNWIWSDVYFVPEPTKVKLFEEGGYDVFELLNGDSCPETNNLQTAFYNEERAKGFHKPIVGSSDSHLTDREDEKYPANGSTVVFAKNRSWECIRDAVMNHRAVAVQHYRGDDHFEIFGDFRMVKYAYFILKNYYPEYCNLCYAQGVLLKEYEMNSSYEIRDLLAELKKRSDAFSADFFGY